jgi:hypothetical protein
MSAQHCFLVRKLVVDMSRMINNMMVVTFLSYMKKNPMFNIVNSKVNFIPLPSLIKDKFVELASFLETQALGVTRSVLLYDTKGFDSRLVFHTFNVLKLKQNQ